MEEKHILGLDLGTNSIGWAIVGQKTDEQGNKVLCGIRAAGSRIIPMDAEVMGDFEKGNTQSQTKVRTAFRSIRHLRERSLLRRERLHRVLHIMGFLPDHYDAMIDRYGKFLTGTEGKLPWVKDDTGHYTFLFKDSYQEMLEQFRTACPDWLKQGAKVPYDWTIYYLRKKALTQPVSKYELAWILLNFNAKRGYYQLRGDDDAMTADTSEKKKREEYVKERVVSVECTGEKRGKGFWYDVRLENGMVSRCTFSEAPDWVGQVKEFVVTTTLDANGNPVKDKEGQVKRSFHMPKKDDWGLVKVRTQNDIDASGKTVGAFIFDAILGNPKQKIRGQLVRTIERKYYKEELSRILKVQRQYIPELTDDALYTEVIGALYPSNDAYRNSIAQKGFVYLLIDDILFYHRPLKSKKSLIDECTYESHTYTDPETGEQKKVSLKCIAKSHPLYQEFRLWQFVGNMRIYQRQKEVNGRMMLDADVTSEFLPDEDSRVQLFDYLNDLKEINQEKLIKNHFKVKVPRGQELPYRWNYVDKDYPCNYTRAMLLTYLAKAGVGADFLTHERELELWHLLYSISDAEELHKALVKYGVRHGLPAAFAACFVKFPAFKKEYGAYSAKAIKRLLPLMRMGRYWSKDAIDSCTMLRINRIIDGEVDDNISVRTREKAIALTQVEHFRALPLWLACYVVYNRHSEAESTERWTCPEDIDRFLNKEFKQYSLRNPIVEQVVTETMRVVRDIWRAYGHIDEIHLEMGRDLKAPADKRKKMSDNMLRNENRNLRVKAMLMELMNPGSGVDNVRPWSQTQQEKMRIYEEGALEADADIEDDIKDIMQRLAASDAGKRPTPSEIKRYTLWLEQRYRSPYTGQTIPIARLFTTDYEIEHVIPQSKYFDDSMSNKVICEAEVNKLKDNQLAYEFIKNHGGEKVTLNGGKVVTILYESAYKQLVQDGYRSNPVKMKKLLMDDVPDGFIERQLNDSRYISRYVKGLLSRIVREENEQEATSKHLVTCSGSVTDRLKHDWGIMGVWNDVIMPRFERMQEIDPQHQYVYTNKEGHKVPDVPMDMQRGFSKKRIDHRHHAMDAIVIACATRDHVNLISNEAALTCNNANRHQLQHKLRRMEEVTMPTGKKRMVPKEFLMPWPSFCADVRQTLEGIVVSFKQNIRVINKTSNRYQKYVNGKKVFVHQVAGCSWAIRKALHKDTVHGLVNLQRKRCIPLKEAMMQPERIVDKDLRSKVRELRLLGNTDKQVVDYFKTHTEVWPGLNLRKIEVYYYSNESDDRYYATRKAIDISFTEDVIRDSIADGGIRNILLRHLQEYGHGDPKVAFSPEGIEFMNANLTALNGGHPHQPIYKVRKFEKANKFAVGSRGNKAEKYVEAAKGTNLFFAIYERKALDKKTGMEVVEREFRTIALNEAIDRLKQGMPVDSEATYILSPNDLVYVPTEEELKQGRLEGILRGSRLYKMVSCSGTKCHFLPQCVANVIVTKQEFLSENKIQDAITGESIKRVGVPIKVDRLGRIVSIGVHKQ